MNDLLELDELSVSYPLLRGLRRHSLRAVTAISLRIATGQTLGLVGESGSGKTTLAQAILGLLPVAGGRLRWRGLPLAADGKRTRAFRRAVQMVFQGISASLDPRMKVGEALCEPLRALAPELDRREIEARCAAMLEAVGLTTSLAERYPQQLSLGQCQRVGIARALIVEPQLLVCDEPVSALDVSIQAQILNLLQRLQRDRDLALLLISHDLAVVRLLCQRIVVLYLGRIMEHAPRQTLFAQPRHPYTQALLAAIVEPGRGLHAQRRSALPLGGEPPSAAAPPSGCVFRTRCPHATAICGERVPPLEPVGDGHSVACHHWRALQPPVSRYNVVE